VAPAGAAPSGSSNSSGAAGPFAGAVAGDGPGAAGPAIPSVAALAALPAEDLAAVALGVGEALMINLSRQRYGEEIADSLFPLSKDEKKILQPLTAEWIRENLPHLTTGEALALMLVITVGQRVAIAEKMRSDLKEKNGVSA